MQFYELVSVNGHFISCSGLFVFIDGWKEKNSLNTSTVIWSVSILWRPIYVIFSVKEVLIFCMC